MDKVIDQEAFKQMSRFRQKVIRLVIIEKKSIYETAIACGCTAEKVRRVLKKWKVLSRFGVSSPPVESEE